jgi:hypothetical protein
MSHFCSQCYFFAEANLRQSKRSKLKTRRCLSNCYAYWPIIGVNPVLARTKIGSKNETYGLSRKPNFLFFNIFWPFSRTQWDLINKNYKNVVGNKSYFVKMKNDITRLDSLVDQMQVKMDNQRYELSMQNPVIPPIESTA